MVSYLKLRIKKTESGKDWKDIKKDIPLSNDVISKINKDEYVSLRSIVKLAIYFKCEISDLVDVYPDTKKEPTN